MKLKMCLCVCICVREREYTFEGRNMICGELRDTNSPLPLNLIFSVPSKCMAWNSTIKYFFLYIVNIWGISKASSEK